MKKYFVLVLLCFSSIILHAGQGSVVFIHGFLTSYRSMIPIKQSLENLCLNLYLWDYRSRNETVEASAEKLACYLQDIAACAPGEPIHFVTHSSGAWVLRAALNDSCCPPEAKIGRAALIAPPNRGSSLARHYRDIPPVAMILGNDMGWELEHFTECDVINLGNFPEEMQVLVIAGCGGRMRYWKDEPNDGYVFLDETALNTPFYFQAFNETHGGLLKDQEVRCLIRSFIYWGFPEEKTSEESPEEIE